MADLRHYTIVHNEYPPKIIVTFAEDITILNLRSSPIAILPTFCEHDGNADGRARNVATSAVSVQENDEDFTFDEGG